MLHIYTGSLHPATGSDDFRLREAYRALRQSLDGDGMLATNTTTVAGRGLTPGELVQHASALPFLAQARMVVVEGLLTAAGSRRQAVEEWQPLIELVPRLPPSNHVVLLEPAAEREERIVLERSPLLHALRAVPGTDVQEFRELRLYGRDSGNEVAHWAAERAAARGVTLTGEAAEALSELLGADLWAVASEVEKLGQYAGGRPVTAADVRLLTPAAREADIFELVDAVVEGRPEHALRLVRKMIEEGTDSPARIQAMVARQLRNLVRAAELIEERAEQSAIGEATGVTHPYPLGRLVRQAGALTRPVAERALRALEASDHAVKTGQLDEVLALELLLYSMQRQPRAASRS